MIDAYKKLIRHAGIESLKDNIVLIGEERTVILAVDDPYNLVSAVGHIRSEHPDIQISIVINGDYATEDPLAEAIECVLAFDCTLIVLPGGIP
jgi:hypothetical protein